MSLSRFGGRRQQKLVSVCGALTPGAGAPFDVDAAAAVWEDDEEDEVEGLLEGMVEAALLKRSPHGYVLHSVLHSQLAQFCG